MFERKRTCTWWHVPYPTINMEESEPRIKDKILNIIELDSSYKMHDLPEMNRQQA